MYEGLGGSVNVQRGRVEDVGAVDLGRRWGKPLGAVRRFTPLLLSVLTAFLATVAIGLFAPSAHAQYKNNQFGFEGGYMYVNEATKLDQHGPLIALRAAYKASDHWWFSARAGLSTRGDIDRSPNERANTVVMFHLVPVEARYYFLTDFTRPFVGISNSFQFLTNQNINASVLWGPGVTTGIEFRLRRDLFIGFQADAYYMLAFGEPDGPLVTLTTQLNFFL